MILKLANIIFNLFLRKPYNLIRRYGSNSWVLITGASDGIGKEFCKELAKQGFNIILVARNLQKLQIVDTELKKINSSVQTKLIIYDFSSTKSYNDLDIIFNQVKALNISMLINNVGMTTTQMYQKFINVPEFDIQNVLTVNTTSMMYLTRKFLPQFYSRPKNTKSAIINVSSQSSYVPSPCISVYAATKAFMNFLSKGVSYEVQDRIDCMVLQTGIVQTNMSESLMDNSQHPPSFLVVSAKNCVKGCLRDLGHEVESYGHWRHALTNILMIALPIFVYYQKQISILKQYEKQTQKNGKKKE